MDDKWLALLIPLGFLIVFPLFWMAIGMLISLWGWHWLAAQYPQPRPFAGQYGTFRSGNVGFSRYNHVLKVGADSDGLWLAVIFLFRVGHPPLFFPWDELTTVQRGGLFFPHLELRFKRSAVRLRLQGRDMEEYLRTASGGRLPLPAQAA